MSVNDLRAVLDNVRGKITRAKETKRLGEQDTKAALIDPVFRALGWDVQDPEEVTREYRRKGWNDPIDYAFLLVRKPRLFVEAKPLGTNLSAPKCANQIVSYASQTGVKWAVLTDGDEYRIYNAYAEVPVEEKLFRSARVSRDGATAEDTLTLLSKDRMTESQLEALWEAHFVDRQVKAELEKLLGVDPDPALVRLLRRRVPKLSAGQIENSLRRARIHPDFPIAPTDGVRVTSSPSKRAPRTGRRPKRADAISSKKRGWKVGVKLAEMIQAGTIRPPLALERTYKGKRLTARIEADGTVSSEGGNHKSLSTAGGMARRSVIGGKGVPATDGWTFWTLQDGPEKWITVADLRSRYLKQTQGKP